MFDNQAHEKQFGNKIVWLFVVCNFYWNIDFIFVFRVSYLHSKKRIKMHMKTLRSLSRSSVCLPGPFPQE